VKLLLWWNQADPRLSRRVRRPLSESENTPLTLEHVLAASALPGYHRDPFDRMLVAQGQVEQLAIVTHDPQVRKYAVETIW